MARLTDLCGVLRQCADGVREHLDADTELLPLHLLGVFADARHGLGQCARVQHHAVQALEERGITQRVHRVLQQRTHRLLA